MCWPAGRPARIDHARLGDQDVRRLRVPPGGDVGLGRRDLLEACRPGAACQARRARLVRPRHRAGQGEVDLAHPGAVAEPAQRAPVPGRQPVAGHATAAPAARRRAARPGRAAARPSERTQRAGLDAARPRRSRAAAIAPVIRALPPSATGQPTPWASAISIRPTAPVGGGASGIMPCAATPASSARPSSVRNRRATPAADRSAVQRRTRPARGTPARGGRRIGDSTRSARSGRSRGPAGRSRPR